MNVNESKCNQWLQQRLPYLSHLTEDGEGGIVYGSRRINRV